MEFGNLVAFSYLGYYLCHADNQFWIPVLYWISGCLPYYVDIVKSDHMGTNEKGKNHIPEVSPQRI